MAGYSRNTFALNVYLLTMTMTNRKIRNVRRSEKEDAVTFNLCLCVCVCVTDIFLILFNNISFL